ncbi:hypothetical protein GC163_11060 [bacterium]|nr:hypothetical protein [bacterium]
MYAAAQEYLESQVLSASPYRLHLLVIDGALKFARVGLAAFESEDWEALELALSRSRDCVGDLIAGVKSDSGLEWADELRGVLANVYRNLVLADPLRDPQKIQDAIRILEIHRETWVELGSRLAEETTSAVPEPHLRAWSA